VLRVEVEVMKGSKLAVQEAAPLLERVLASSPVRHAEVKVDVRPAILRTARARARARQRGSDDHLVLLGALEQQVTNRVPLLGREHTARICESIAMISASSDGPSPGRRRTATTCSASLPDQRATASPRRAASWTAAHHRCAWASSNSALMLWASRSHRDALLAERRPDVVTAAGPQAIDALERARPRRRTAAREAHRARRAARGGRRPADGLALPS
jgi:hypothetical protein